MCTAPVLATTLLGLAQTGVGLAGQAAERRALEAQNARRAEEARAAARAEFDRLQSERDEARAETAVALADGRREALEARARVRVAAGEAGVSGLSIAALEREIAGRDGRRADALAERFEATDRATRRGLEDAARGARVSIARLPTPSAPDYLGAGLRAGLRLVDAVSAARR